MLHLDHLSTQIIELVLNISHIQKANQTLSGTYLKANGSLLFWITMWTIFQKNVLLFVQTPPTKLCSEFSSIS